MIPDILHFGPVPIHLFGIFLALGFLAAGWAAGREFERKGYDPALASSAVVWAAVGGLVGARLWILLDAWPEFVRAPWTFLVTGRGLRGDLRAPLAASARARARRRDPRALPRALRRGALPGRVRAREPAHRLRAHRSAAREPHAGRGRRMVAPLEAGVAGGRGLRILLVTGALGLAVAGGLLALARRGPTLAPDFVVPDLAGRTVRLSGLRGKVVVLNLWATWCAPCIEEMPSMERLYGRLRDTDFALLAISQDEDGKRVVAPFVERMHLTFPVLLDPERQVGDRYGVTGYPETFLIARNGYVVEHVVGPRDWAAPDEIAALEALIAAGDRGGAPPAPRAPS